MKTLTSVFKAHFGRPFRFCEGVMKIYSSHFHPNGLFINCEAQEGFWVLLSISIGWGRFTMIRPDQEFSATGGIFQLTELRPPAAEQPESVVEGSNVLWRLPEALEVLKSFQPSSRQEDWQLE